MADYKAIHGKNILSLASDLDSAEGEGQIWFNTTSSDYKTIVLAAGAWATSQDLPAANQGAMGFGTSTAALVASGLAPPGIIVDTYTYDGSSWTEVADVNAGRRGGCGLGSVNTA